VFTLFISSCCVSLAYSVSLRLHNVFSRMKKVINPSSKGPILWAWYVASFVLLPYSKFRITALLLMLPFEVQWLGV
jgi:hypothetical protein